MARGQRRLLVSIASAPRSGHAGATAICWRRWRRSWRGSPDRLKLALSTVTCSARSFRGLDLPVARRDGRAEAGPASLPLDRAGLRGNASLGRWLGRTAAPAVDDGAGWSLDIFVDDCCGEATEIVTKASANHGGTL